MNSPTTRQLWHGTDTPTDAGRRLVAGPVTALLDGADLRNVRVGDVEIAQRIYLAVRDDVWNTIPATLSDIVVDATDHTCDGRFPARHTYADIDFGWSGRITGAADGTITYEFNGTA